MSLIRRKMTPKLLAAVRSNGRTSRGPLTERGKRNSSRSAGTHLAYARLSADCMKAFGEDWEEFVRHRRAPMDAFQPRDYFERSLVAEIAVLQWRRGRVYRAEEGAIAHGIRKLEIERNRKGLHHGGPNDHAETSMVGLVGYTGLGPSPENFALVLTCLENFRTAVEATGFQPDNLVFLRLLYGKHPGLRGALLKAEFERFQRRGKPAAGDAQTMECSSVAVRASP